TDNRQQERARAQRAPDNRATSREQERKAKQAKDLAKDRLPVGCGALSRVISVGSRGPTRVVVHSRRQSPMRMIRRLRGNRCTERSARLNRYSTGIRASA